MSWATFNILSNRRDDLVDAAVFFNRGREGGGSDRGAAEVFSRLYQLPFSLRSAVADAAGGSPIAPSTSTRY